MNDTAWKEHSWEDVNADTSRLLVPGGWLYRCGVSMVFVPFPPYIHYHTSDPQPVYPCAQHTAWPYGTVAGSEAH